MSVALPGVTGFKIQLMNLWQGQDHKTYQELHEKMLPLGPGK